jgi:hypothetical protein
MMATYEYELCVGTPRGAAKSEYHSSRLLVIVDTLLFHDLRTGLVFPFDGLKGVQFLRKWKLQVERDDTRIIATTNQSEPSEHL